MPTYRAIIAEQNRQRKQLSRPGAQSATWFRSPFYDFRFLEARTKRLSQLFELLEQHLFDKLTTANITRVGKLVEGVDRIVVQF